jgi:hypothetical protein
MKKIFFLTFVCFYICTTQCQIIINDSIKIIKQQINLTPQIINSNKTSELFHSIYFDSISNSCNNQNAKFYFENRLNAMKIYIYCMLDNYNSIDSENIFLLDSILMGSIMDGILNFQYLTGIHSESTHDFAGTYQPTKNDVLKWEEWYNLNKEFLCWDEKTGLIYCISRK